MHLIVFTKKPEILGRFSCWENREIHFAWVAHLGKFGWFFRNR